jgi:sulfatase modifying factor 1
MSDRANGMAGFRQNMNQPMANRFHAGILVAIVAIAGVASADEPSSNAPPHGMVFVPSGRYQPLFRSENDPAELPVRGFYLDVLPVTNNDFLKFVEANPRWQRSNVKRLFADEQYLKHWAADLELGAAVTPDSPVTHVSWFAAKAYAGWKGRRLPTTDEWEYAAGASPTRADGWNDPDFKWKLLSWYSTASPGTLPPVGLNPANFYGIHDLHGLVWEWVADFNTAMVTGDARGDTGLDRQLFCASGSEGTKFRDNYPAFMRSAFRSSLKAAYTVHNLGFRCAKDP